MEPNEETPRPKEIGWRIVVASLVLPLAWVVTGSVTLTVLVAGFSFLSVAQLHPEIAQITRESQPLYMLVRVAPLVVVAIFLAALVQSARSLFS
ncbi:MAG: hypothetical protein MUD01_22105 [Chloroflexaceae bacterium]|jgi:hypothetical protein|nr:hypothetical protein [Chloroflexaceae bacterium]